MDAPPIESMKFFRLLILILPLHAGNPWAAPYPSITWLPEVKTDPASVALGKRLFFDPRLSLDETTSCASCHDPRHGYASDQKLSPAVAAGRGFRNVPGLINTIYRQQWGWDGRHASLGGMIEEMITDPFALGMDPQLLDQRLAQDETYVTLFAEAGLTPVSTRNARIALIEYLKMLTSRNAPVDTGMLEPPARRGRELFEGKAGCIRCHNGPMLTDELAHNNGTSSNPEDYREPEIRQALSRAARRAGTGTAEPIETDTGRALVSGNPADEESWITPSLRELSQTGPYMHNGRYASLVDVVEAYYFGESHDPNKDPQLQPLDLSLEEVVDLIAFLEALSGRTLDSPRYVHQEQWPKDYPAQRYWSERAGQRP